MPDATDQKLSLITDLAFPTRTGTSVAQLTTPGFTFARRTSEDTAEFGWSYEHRTQAGHYIVEVIVPLGDNEDIVRGLQKQQFTEWDASRGLLPGDQGEITDIEAWDNEIVAVDDGGHQGNRNGRARRQSGQPAGPRNLGQAVFDGEMEDVTNEQKTTQEDRGTEARN